LHDPWANRVFEPGGKQRLNSLFHYAGIPPSESNGAAGDRLPEGPFVPGKCSAGANGRPRAPLSRGSVQPPPEW
jgi:hypothetical protein